MSVTVIRKGQVLQIVDADGELPIGQAVKLFTEEELRMRLGFTPQEYVQLESVYAEHEDDWGDSLDSLTISATP